MFKSMKTSQLRAGPLTCVLIALACGLAFLPGCTEPLTSYQVQGVSVAHGQKILVLPFMDTRTFTDSSDPHKYDLGYYARTIFVDSMRPYSNGRTIYTPNLPLVKKSLANAEVAELGRRMGADIVVAGQIFSFTDTRAASIPPRAGMFIRVISARDGSLLFAGDHYQAANVPGGGGGRDGQARKVADLLVQGFLANSRQLMADAGRIASTGAFAMLSPVPMKPAAMSPSKTKPEALKHRSVLKTVVDLSHAGGKTQKKSGGKNSRDSFQDPEPLPEPPPLPDLSSFAELLNSEDWQKAPPAPAALPAPANLGAEFLAMPSLPDAGLLAMANQPKDNAAVTKAPAKTAARTGLTQTGAGTAAQKEALSVPSAAALVAADAAVRQETARADAKMSLSGPWDDKGYAGGTELPNLNDLSYFEKTEADAAGEAPEPAANPGDWGNESAAPWPNASPAWTAPAAPAHDDVDSWEPDAEDSFPGFPGAKTDYFQESFSEIAPQSSLGIPNYFDQEPLAGNAEADNKPAPAKTDGDAAKNSAAAPASQPKTEVDKALELTKAIDSAREAAKTAVAQPESPKPESAPSETVHTASATAAAAKPPVPVTAPAAAKSEAFVTEPEPEAGKAAVAVAAPAAAPTPAPAPEYAAYLATYAQDDGAVQSNSSYTYSYSSDYSAEPGFADIYAVSEPVDTASAACIDELPEIELKKVDPFMISADEVYPKPNLAAKISGDQLAGDLLASDGGLYGAAMVMPDPPVIVGGRKEDPIDPGMVYLPLAVTLNGEEYASLPTEPFVLDPETLEVVSGKLPVTRVPAPVVERRTVVTQAAQAQAAQAQAAQAQAQAAPQYSPVPYQSEAVPPALGRPEQVYDGPAGLATGPRRPGGRAEVRGDTVVKVPVPPETAVTSDVTVMDGTPVDSRPLVAEQPRTLKSVDFELQEDPYSEMQDAEARIAFPRKGNPDAARILILPYYDRQNPNNLIANTGGGEVVTTLYGTQLALDPALQVLWDASGRVAHDRPIGRQEALELARLAKADFVMRGEVVEFRRAQSVPSLFSAVISTAVLAAQVFFAEMSGVDVATEVYRVSDGVCIVSRRDRAQQKYVVQAEKTVRRMAGVMADDVARAIRNPNLQPMDPLIDEISPVTVLTNPR